MTKKEKHTQETQSTEKVFCDDCKCRFDLLRIDHPKAKDVRDSFRGVYVRCREGNNHNQCEDFEPSIFYKIKKFFGG